MVTEDELNKLFKTFKPNINSHEIILDVFNNSLEYLKKIHNYIQN